MAKLSKGSSRAAQRREEAAVKMSVIGAGMALVALFLQSSPLGKAFAALFPIGLLILAGGGALLWLGRQKDRGPKPGPSVSVGPTSPSLNQGHAQGPPPSDRVFAEFERRADQPNVARSGPKVRPTGWGPSVFDVIEWRRFEAVVEALFQQAGLQTKSQSHGPDGGVDIWLYSPAQPDQPACLVQCKHWNTKQVGVDKIRELRGVMAAREVGRGVLATTSSFSPDAITFGQENSIDLLDVSRLLSIIAKRTSDQQAELLDVALEGEYWRPTCASCGIKMVERTPRGGGKPFWGCQNYPKCKSTLPMRAG